VKRSKALQSLSRDHHHALRVAQQLRRAEDADRAANTFFDYWSSEGRRHFEVEEEVLLPYWALLGNFNREAVTRLSLEHLRIRAAALKLSREPSLELAGELGAQLADHIRFEERELFPLMEADLGEEALQDLASAVSAAERQA
jgi:hemerythrin-like domain-containing protein